MHPVAGLLRRRGWSERDGRQTPVSRPSLPHQVVISTVGHRQEVRAQRREEFPVGALADLRAAGARLTMAGSKVFTVEALAAEVGAGGGRAWSRQTLSDVIKDEAKDPRGQLRRVRHGVLRLRTSVPPAFPAPSPEGRSHSKHHVLGRAAHVGGVGVRAGHAAGGPCVPG